MQETIGQVIRRLRKERCMTQEEFADALGVTAQAVSKWENDVGIPDVSQFVPIANLFNVSIDTLFSRENKTTDEQVRELLRGLDQKDVPRNQEYMELTDALRRYPNHPDLLERIVRRAIYLVEPENPKYNQTVMKLFHGVLREEDYLWKIEAPEFTPLYGNPRFQALIKRYKDFTKQ